MERCEAVLVGRPTQQPEDVLGAITAVPSGCCDVRQKSLPGPTSDGLGIDTAEPGDLTRREEPIRSGARGGGHRSILPYLRYSYKSRHSVWFLAG